MRDSISILKIEIEKIEEGLKKWGDIPDNLIADKVIKGEKKHIERIKEDIEILTNYYL